MERFYLHGDGRNIPPIKTQYRNEPLPALLNAEVIEIAKKFGYQKLLEVVENAKAKKRFGAAEFSFNGMRLAKFDFVFGVCTRVVYCFEEVGDTYAEIKEKLKKIYGQLIPIAKFEESYVPPSLVTKRPHEIRDKKSASYKDKYLKGAA